MTPIFDGVQQYDDGIMSAQESVGQRALDQINKRARGPKAGEQRECKACGAPLVFARTQAGKIMPITLTVKIGGTILLFKGEDGVLECRTLSGDTLTDLHNQGVLLRLSHFADCPRADEFRKQRIRSAP